MVPPDFPPRNEGLPAFALAITYRTGNMHYAEYRLFEMPARRSLGRSAEPTGCMAIWSR